MMILLLELMGEFIVAVYNIHVKPVLKRIGIKRKRATDKMMVAVNREAKKVESAKYCKECIMYRSGFCVMYGKETCDCIDECRSYGEVPTLKKKDRLNIREDFSSK